MRTFAGVGGERKASEDLVDKARSRSRVGKRAKPWDRGPVTASV
jgi:hypothetical protein